MSSSINRRDDTFGMDGKKIMDENNGQVAREEEIDEVAALRSLNPSELDCFKHCPFLMYAIITASFGGVIFGFDTAALNGILVMPSFLTLMGKDEQTDQEWATNESWIVSSLLLACFFGAPFAAPLSDYFGRKWCIIMAMFGTAVGSVIQAGAMGFTTMIAGRIIAGISIGLLSGIIPVYLAEVAPKSIRGSAGSLFYLTLAVGILFAFLVTLGFNTLSVTDTGEFEPNNWRYILAIQAGLAIFLLGLMIPLTESPRWLISVGKVEQGRKVLFRTRWNLPLGRRKNEKNEWVTLTNIDVEYDEIIAEVIENAEMETAWYDYSVLFQPAFILRTSLGIFIQFFQQLSGINSFFYYSSVIYQDLGIVPDSTTAVTGAVSVVATFISIFFIDKLGRRPLLIYGSLGMMLSLIIVGGTILSSSTKGVADVNDLQRNVVTVFICFYIVNFSYSYGPIGWSLVMTLWAMFNVHETMNLSLEYVNEVFGASTWTEYFEYSRTNFAYTFYFGNKTMLEYSQEGKIDFKKVNKPSSNQASSSERNVAYHENPLGTVKPMSMQNEDNFQNEV